MVKRSKGNRSKKTRLDADLDQDVDGFEPSESEEEFGKQEKILLDTRRGTRKHDSEEEVFGIHSSQDEDDAVDEDEEADRVGSDMDSDIEGQGSDGDSEAGLPDSKAWGRRSSKYYHTDYVDKDFSGVLSKEDEELADMEEEEAMNIQKRLMSHMNEADFTLGLLDEVEAKKLELSKKASETVASEKIVSDLSKMSNSEKLQLLKQESPEMFKLIDDYKDYMGLARDRLLPLIDLVRSRRLNNSTAADFVQTFFSVINNYSMNIVFYLVLKSKRDVALDHHPVIQRLFAYKKVADEMSAVFDDKLVHQVDAILESAKQGSLMEPSAKKKKRLNILDDTKRLEAMVERKKMKLQAKIGEDIIEDVLSRKDDHASLDEESTEEDDEEEDAAETKRQITYEMKKNKGLTPRRKKEDRNPRVKNRNKYRKAKIRRKGQVRDVRKESDRYGGETSGIKAYTSRSVKLKV